VVRLAVVQFAGKQRRGQNANQKDEELHDKE
jgi:hypothetical protein